MKNLVFLVLFIGIFYLTSYLFPFIATSEKYKDTSTPNSHFSIAILENGKQGIVTWDKYSKNKNRYLKSLVITPSTNKTYLNEFEFFTLSTDSHDAFELDAHQDNYRFWSKYKIDNGEIIPISFFDYPRLSA